MSPFFSAPTRPSTVRLGAARLAVALVVLGTTASACGGDGDADDATADDTAGAIESADAETGVDPADATGEQSDGEPAVAAFDGKPGEDACGTLVAGVVAETLAGEATLQDAYERDDVTACTFVVPEDPDDAASPVSTYVVQFATDFHGSPQDQREALEGADPSLATDPLDELGDGAFGMAFGSLIYQIIGPSPVSASMTVSAPDEASAAVLFAAVQDHLD